MTRLDPGISGQEELPGGLVLWVRSLILGCSATPTVAASQPPAPCSLALRLPAVSGRANLCRALARLAREDVVRLCETILPVTSRFRSARCHDSDGWHISTNRQFSSADGRGCEQD